MQLPISNKYGIHTLHIIPVFSDILYWFSSGLYGLLHKYVDGMQNWLCVWIPIYINYGCGNQEPQAS